MMNLNISSSERVQPHPQQWQHHPKPVQAQSPGFDPRAPSPLVNGAQSQGPMYMRGDVKSPSMYQMQQPMRRTPNAGYYEGSHAMEPPQRVPLQSSQWPVVDQQWQMHPQHPPMPQHMHPQHPSPMSAPHPPHAPMHAPQEHPMYYDIQESVRSQMAQQWDRRTAPGFMETMPRQPMPPRLMSHDGMQDPMMHHSPQPIDPSAWPSGYPAQSMPPMQQPPPGRYYEPPRDTAPAMKSPVRPGRAREPHVENATMTLKRLGIDGLKAHLRTLLTLQSSRCRPSAKPLATSTSCPKTKSAAASSSASSRRTCAGRCTSS